jgi:hypothetical protein
MFRIIVAGSRYFDDFDLLCEKLDFFLREKEGMVTIVSGAAKGADLLGEKYAEMRGYYVQRYPADWDKYGRGAGPIRNKQMAKDADALVAFRKKPDGTAGTNNMIKTAKDIGLKVRIVNY